MRNRYVLLADMPFIALAAFGAFALRFDWLFPEYRAEFFPFVLGVVLIKPPVLFLFGMYNRYWRYASAQDLVAVTLAVSAASVVTSAFIGLAFAFELIAEFSRPVVLIDWLLSLLLIGGLRMSVRVIGEARERAQRVGSGQQVRRVLIIGAGEAGTMVVKELRRNPQLGIEPVGYLDDAVEKHDKWIGGVRVLGSVADIADVVAEHRVNQVIIAMPAAGGAVVRSVAEACRKAGVESRTVPGVYELLGGRVSVNRLRNVEITDLLRRGHLAGADLHSAARYLTGATVLVSGAGGSIGSELCRQVAHVGPASLVLLGHGENSIFDIENQLRDDFPSVRCTAVIADIRDERRIETIFAQHRPTVVLHAAAHKHVPLMEANPVEAISNNVFGTYTLAQAALRYGAQKFVLISTDKAVSPTSIMGASKRMAELMVRSLSGSTSFVVVRFGNVLGSRGSVVPIFKNQIERGGPITITHPEMKRFFMTIPEAVNLVLRAGGLGEGGELFVLNMGQPVRIRDLAEDLIRLSGFSLSEIPIVFTDLRPGEKLEEALCEPESVIDRTSEPDILRVSEPANALDVPVSVALADLRRAVDSADQFAIEAVLASCVPSFVPRLPDAMMPSAAGRPLH